MSLVVYGNPLVNRIEGSLRTAFGQRFLRLTRRPDKLAPEFKVQLAHSTAVISEGDSMYLEIRSRNQQGDGASSGFWFGFTATFQIQTRDHVLTQTSLRVLHRLAGKLVPLFRVDWDQQALEGHSNHAQPHWHFTQSPACIESIVRGALCTDEQKLPDFAPHVRSELFSDSAAYDKFHFALTSLWEKNEQDSCKRRRFSSEDFPKWFESLVLYIADQIDYLVERSPALSAPSVREFVPSGGATTDDRA